MVRRNVLNLDVNLHWEACLGLAEGFALMDDRQGSSGVFKFWDVIWDVSYLLVVCYLL